jgi:hypothetical protein
VQGLLAEVPSWAAAGGGEAWDRGVRPSTALTPRAPLALKLPHRYAEAPSSDQCFPQTRALCKWVLVFTDTGAYGANGDNALVGGLGGAGNAAASYWGEWRDGRDWWRWSGAGLSRQREETSRSKRPGGSGTWAGSRPFWVCLYPCRWALAWWWSDSTRDSTRISAGHSVVLTIGVVVGVETG